MRTQQEQQGIRKARKAGLHYVQDLDGGWRRRRCGRGFAYFSSGGKRIVGKRTLQRIAALAIPPAWEDVRICPSPSGLLTDAKVASVIQRCEEVNGQFLFCYHDDVGDYHPVSSSDVNGYLHVVAGEPSSTKDFRTWSASVMALKHLKGDLEEAGGRRRGGRSRRR